MADNDAGPAGRRYATYCPPTGRCGIHLDDSEMATAVSSSMSCLDGPFRRNHSYGNEGTEHPNDAIIGQMHDYIVVYAKDIQRFATVRNRLLRTDDQEAAYQNPDNNPYRGPWRNDNYTSNKSKEERAQQLVPIVRPADGVEIWPKPHAVWRYSPERHAQNVAEDRLWWGAAGLNNMPKLKEISD